MEILSPAGDMERLIMALTYGADAVYLAGQRFGMRAASANFAPDEMRRATAMCREKGVKVYVTANALPRNDDVAAMPEFLEQIQDAGADAVIVADIGVMQLAKKYAPRLSLHVSTQAGIVNFETARALCDMGAKRAILARELTLAEIAEIRAKTPREMELEAFGHGSMCMSFSGRCLLSNYLTARDANRGECSQPCRWKYHLVEEKRPGEYMEISEDGGTHIMNSRDLCMIDHLQEMISAGITSLKIEGRMKSTYYAAAVTNAYRHARDAAVRGEPLDPIWRDEVMKVSHREYSTGFYFNKSGPGQYYQNAIYFSDSDVVAQVESCSEDGSAVLTQRNKFSRGDGLELLMPQGRPIAFTAARMINAEGEEIASTPHPMMTFRMKLPVYAPKYSFLRREKH